MLSGAVAAVSAFFRALAESLRLIDERRSEDAGGNRVIVEARRGEDERIQKALDAERSALDEFDRDERLHDADDR
jgi:hypothetical protein